MVDLRYHIEKRLRFWHRNTPHCPVCGARAIKFIDEGHYGPGYGAPHIAREYSCRQRHIWKQASYDGVTWRPIEH